MVSGKKDATDIALLLGLVNKKDGKESLYDFFRNRIIFPIKNRQGNVLAFAGRTIGEDKAKYINSKESEIFSKRKILYGLGNFNKLNGRRPKYVFIVEGYTDVLMMNKCGLYNVVATMGTSLTLEHANEIKKISNKVILCYDSDSAGIDASFKNIEPLYQFGIEIFSLRLEKGSDPCSYLEKYGREEFIQKAKKSNSIMDEYMDYLKDKYIEKELSINEVLENFIGKIGDDIGHFSLLEKDGKYQYFTLKTNKKYTLDSNSPIPNTYYKDGSSNVSLINIDNFITDFGNDNLIIKLDGTITDTFGRALNNGTAYYANYGGVKSSNQNIERKSGIFSGDLDFFASTQTNTDNLSLYYKTTTNNIISFIKYC